MRNRGPSLVARDLEIPLCLLYLLTLLTRLEDSDRRRSLLITQIRSQHNRIRHSQYMYAVVLNTGEASIFDQKMRFLTILKISDFCQKFGFWVFLEVTGHSGILEISIFLIFSRFQNFDFFDFLGGLKILAGGYGAVLVGVSMM